MRALRKLVKATAIFSTVLVCAALLLAYTAGYISPVERPYIAFFGLAYPVILVATILTGLFWLAKWSRWAWFVLAVILIGIPVHTKFFAFSPTTKTQSGSQNTLSIMSYNVELFGWYYWKDNIQRRNKIFDQLADNPADIYCFQEFFYTDEPGRFDTRDSLTTLLKTPHYFDHYTHHMHDVQYYGIATLSKYPIINQGVIEFPNDKNNICIFTDVQTETEVVRIYNGHLCSIRFSSEEHEYVGQLQTAPNAVEKTKIARMVRRLKTAFEKRAWQAELVRKHMDECPYPIIFCGDFNDTPTSFAYKMFSDTLNDLFISRGNGIGGTYIGNFPSFRIDYIFASEHFTPLKLEVLPEELSDHHAIYGQVGY